MSLIALAFSLMFVRLLLPLFNSMAGKTITVTEAFGVTEVFFMLAVSVLTGLAAGAYPALFLSRFDPVDAVKGDAGVLGGKGLLRKALVTTQFAGAIVLLIGTIIASVQLDFLRNRDNGLTSDEILVVPISDRSLIPAVEALEQEMAGLPNVLSVSTSHRVPGENTNGEMMRRDGFEPVGTRSFGIDDDFLSTYEIQLLAGRAFLDTGIDTASSTVLINRAALEAFGWTDPTLAIGETIHRGSTPQVIVGVTENFNYRSLHHAVQPLVMSYYGFRMYMSLRIQRGDISHTIERVENKWASFSPGFPLTYYFLDEQLDAQYSAEERIDRLFSGFAGLAILIACMGLFGLSAFTVERRTKEIGVRKVLGATVGQLIVMLSSEYTSLVLIAWMVATPIAYLGAAEWMTGFSYQADIGVWPFLIAGMVTILVAWLTVSFQSLKTASSDPVAALRYE